MAKKTMNRGKPEFSLVSCVYLSESYVTSSPGKGTTFPPHWAARPLIRRSSWHGWATKLTIARSSLVKGWVVSSGTAAPLDLTGFLCLAV